MKATGIKNDYFIYIVELFKKYGFEFVNEYQPKFLLRETEYVVQAPFTIKPNGEIWAGKFMLCIWKIENIILDVGIPTNDFKEQKKRETEFLTTVSDKEGNIDFNMNTPIKTDQTFSKYSSALIQYIENDGKKFVGNYASLPNLLLEMDSLQSEGKYWHEILGGGPEFLFRGLIISKLCNDPDFERKVAWVDEVMKDDMEDWQPYYERLKSKLASLPS
jgi:hypothetical protein